MKKRYEENIRKVEKHKVNFKKVDKDQLKEKTSKVNKFLGKIPTTKLAGTKSLINAVQNYADKNMGKETCEK